MVDDYRITAEEVELVLEADAPIADTLDSVETVSVTDVELERDVERETAMTSWGSPTTREYSGTMSLTLEGVISDDTEIKTEAMEKAMEATMEARVDMETFEFEVDPEVAERTYERICEEIEEAEREGVDADQIILGVEQYKALYTYAAITSGRGVETTPEMLLGTEILTVPGPMVHIPRVNQRMLAEYGTTTS